MSIRPLYEAPKKHSRPHLLTGLGWLSHSSLFGRVLVALEALEDYLALERAVCFR